MIVTATIRALEQDDTGALVTLHLAGDPQVAQATAEQLVELVPLVSALADGQTDLGELAHVAAELPTVKRLLEAFRIGA